MLEDNPVSRVMLPHLPPLRRGLTLGVRIALINVFAMGLMIAGLFYFGHDMDRFINTEVNNLIHQADLIAGTLGEVAVEATETGDRLQLDNTRQIVRRLVTNTDVRTQVFSTGKLLVADSRLLMGAGRYVQIEELPPPDAQTSFAVDWRTLLDRVVMLFPYKQGLPLFQDTTLPAFDQIPDVQEALAGKKHWTLWTTSDDQLMLTVAVPIQRLRQVVGVVMLSRDSDHLADAIRQLRFDLLQGFLIVAAIGVLLSLYLARTIVRPLRRLARAATGAEILTGRRPVIPDYTRRGDEVGDLSAALRGMTTALWQRLDAIERFAADVSHELKNPLTSMHSAIETIARVDNDAQRLTLLGILREDMQRMERLITDISAASRLEAELARTTPEDLDLADFTETLVANRAQTGAPIFFTRTGTRHHVRGIPGRLAQVLENLVANALSFSPPDKAVHVQVLEHGHLVRLLVDDDGPGIPYGKEEKIFERFYSERPHDESFGQHSGLGLSICRQIVEGLGGHIYAENRVSSEGQILGARFVVDLPGLAGR